MSLGTKEKFEIRKRYDKREEGKYAQRGFEETRTQQQFKDECDVNNILAKYKRTGMVTHINKHGGQFGDFSGVEDYQTALGKVMEAQNSFSLLPSEIRSRFLNDPARLIDFMSKPENKEEAIKLGLVKVPAPTQPTLQEQMEIALENNDKKRKAKVETK